MGDSSLNWIGPSVVWLSLRTEPPSGKARASPTQPIASTSTRNTQLCYSRPFRCFICIPIPSLSALTSTQPKTCLTRSHWPISKLPTTRFSYVGRSVEAVMAEANSPATALRQHHLPHLVVINQYNIDSLLRSDTLEKER